MKKIFVALFSAVLLFAACDKYDDSALQNRMNTLEGRVTDLEAKVNSINADIASLQALVKALQDNITVDVISKTKDGYDITFSDGVTVSISNGEKGDTPRIGVKAEGNVFYWTVDGEWLLDGDGERVIVTGAVPQVKIKDGKWFVSYDGKNWQDLGSAESMSGLVVTEDANFVYLTVPGSGTTITLSKTGRFTLDIASLEYMILPGATTEIPYSIYGADGTEKLFVQSNDFKVTYDASKIYVTPKAGVISGDVLVMAVRNSDQAVCGVVLSFSEGVFEVTPAVTIMAAGGDAKAFVKTNADYEVVIPDNAKDWLSVAPETKAVRTDTLIVTAKPNESEESRTAKVEFRPSGGASVYMTVFQAGKSQYPAITIAEFLALPDDDTNTYQLTGTITVVRHSTYGNFEMKDETGTVYVYGLKDKNGENVFTPLGLKKGDKVTLHGTRNVHNGTVEVHDAVYESHIKGEDIPEVIEEVTIAEFLAKPVSTEVWYKLTGKITEIANTTYGNFYMEDETGSVYVYGLTATKQESNDKSFSSLGLKVGDTLTAIGFRSEYTKEGVTTIEFGGTTPAYYVSHVPGEGGDPDTPGEASGVFTSSIEWALGDNAYDGTSSTPQKAVINDESVDNVLKLGTSSKAGTATLTIPEGVTKIGFYAVAWKGLSTADIDFDGETVTVKGNDGASGNPEYTIVVSDDDYYEIEVSEGDLTITSAKRVIIFGINPVTEGEEEEGE
ncbi:MAG: hypothetical protein IKX07_07235 [Bacteroidales bacterium]|nr:hypothetical protein [Bacteroidales bacterium]MBR5055367.1 hypothetical protein [Bacteroidales bacterium]